MSDHWKDFWANQRDPMHRSSRKEFYDLHGRELSMLLPDLAGRALLDVGCGDGALFEPLGLGACGRYVGVDLSSAMLDAFAQRHPSLDLRVGDAVDLPVEEHFDCVLSNGVVQYLSHADFVQHLKAVRSRLRANGMYLCGSVPARERWFGFAVGAAAYPRRRHWVRAFKESIRFAAGRSSLGTWYSLADVEAAAGASGFEAAVFGSACYLYRYHLVFRPI